LQWEIVKLEGRRRRVTASKRKRAAPGTRRGLLTRGINQLLCEVERPQNSSRENVKGDGTNAKGHSKKKAGLGLFIFMKEGKPISPCRGQKIRQVGRGG